MEKYISLEHMIPVDPNEELNYYIPHHHVWKTGKKDNKFEVVSDDPLKSKDNLSLNNTLMIGPVKQPDLTNILMKFRTYPIPIVNMTLTKCTDK